MTGFEFGSERDIEKKLVAILESEEYVRAVQHWEKKRNLAGHLHGHDSRWGNLFSSHPREDLSNSSLSLSFDGSTSSGGEPPTPSENHLSHPPLNEPNREPVDPTSGYHPLLSIYYLVREKLKRDRVYGPGLFASSQLSIQDPSSKADYNIALPRLPVPETLHYLGTSYGNANANKQNVCLELAGGPSEG